MSDTTPAYWFEQFFANKIKDNPGLSKDVNAKFQFNVEGAGGGTWTVDLSKEPGEVITGATEGPGCTIIMTCDDFVAMMKKTQSPMNLYMTQRLKVQGNLGLAMKLQQLIK